MVMQNLYPDIDKQDSNGKKGKKGVHIAFDTEYLAEKVGEKTLISDHTSRSTESNPSEIGADMEMISGRLRPRWPIMGLLSKSDTYEEDIMAQNALSVCFSVD